MKIKIVTFHCVYNYGAVLQSYALYRILRARGHEVEFVDYCPPALFRPYRIFRWHPHLLVDPQGISLIAKKIRFKRFFRQQLPCSQRKYITNDELCRNPPLADAYVCGSDQIWNPEIFGGRNDETYFLNFAPKNSRRIAYAASLGGACFPDVQQEEVRLLLDSFDFISCRERGAQKSVMELSRTPARLVLDPTLLWNDYSELLNSHYSDEENLFVYALQPNIFLDNTVGRLSRKLGLRPYIVEGSWKFWQQHGVSHYPSPCDWLSRLKNARFVITNSFHGTVFSILFRKPFVTIPLAGGGELRNCRIVELLHGLGLESRLLDSATENVEQIADEPIDWDQVFDKLEKYRCSSFQFLEDARI